MAKKSNNTEKIVNQSLDPSREIQNKEFVDQVLPAAEAQHQEVVAKEIGYGSDLEVENYQKSLKKTLNQLASCFSLILIIVGLYLLVNGLFGIVNRNYQNVATDNNNSFTDNTAFVLKELPGSIDDGGLFTQKAKAETKNAADKASETSMTIRSSGKWKATDYVKGDIGFGTYEVKLGDTLWEISEAVYGSGFEWGKILEKNKEKIGFLPDGSQALIFPGQKLNITR